MKVDFIIAGGQKCGTTALHYFLSKHPKIVVSNPKEIDFFNYDFSYNKGFKYYHSFFKEKPLLYNVRGYKFLEASPSYINGDLFADSSVTAKRIFDYNSKIKIICLVRDPIDRAYSAWEMFRKMFRNEKENWWFKWFEDRIGTTPTAVKRSKQSFIDFDYFINEEMQSLIKGDIMEMPVLKNGKYIDYIKKFNSVFNNNLIIVQNEILNNNTEIELNRICKLLNVSEFNWDFTNKKKIFKASYTKKISIETKKTLKEFYFSSNMELLEFTGINYL